MLIGGWPGGRDWVHLLATRRRCQRGTVAGVTSRCARSARGSSLINTAMIPRSAGQVLGPCSPCAAWPPRGAGRGSRCSWQHLYGPEVRARPRFGRRRDRSDARTSARSSRIQGGQVAPASVKPQVFTPAEFSTSTRCHPRSEASADTPPPGHSQGDGSAARPGISSHCCKPRPRSPTAPAGRHRQPAGSSASPAAVSSQTPTFISPLMPT